MEGTAREDGGPGLHGQIIGWVVKDMGRKTKASSTMGVTREQDDMVREIGHESHGQGDHGHGYYGRKTMNSETMGT